MEFANRQQPSGERRGGGGRRERRETLRRVTDTLNLRRRRKKPTREEVEQSLPSFWPVFTVVVAVIEVVLLAAVMGTEGVALIAFTPETEHRVITSFSGQYLATISRQEVPNYFIGPSPAALIHTGAKYSPVSITRSARRGIFEDNLLPPSCSV